MHGIYAPLMLENVLIHLFFINYPENCFTPRGLNLSLNNKSFILDHLDMIANMFIPKVQAILLNTSPNLTNPAAITVLNPNATVFIPILKHRDDSISRKQVPFNPNAECFIPFLNQNSDTEYSNSLHFNETPGSFPMPCNYLDTSVNRNQFHFPQKMVTYCFLSHQILDL